MSNQHFSSIDDIEQMFDVGQRIYYACLYPKYDWFEKTFSIKKIIEPTLTKIIGNQIYPDTMNQDDRFITAHSGFKNVIRKFKMYVDLDIVERFAVDIYENINKEILIVYENHVTIGFTQENIEEDFYKSLISIKPEIDSDLDTIIIKDLKFDIFTKLYNDACDKYPEKIIKYHDKNLKKI